jgi:hypothetical protein
MPTRENKKKCVICRSGASCLQSIENSSRVRLYTPAGAIRAMLAGKILKDEEGKRYRWDSDAFIGFIPNKKDNWFIADYFRGLYEEL